MPPAIPAQASRSPIAAKGNLAKLRGVALIRPPWRVLPVRTDISRLITKNEDTLSTGDLRVQQMGVEHRRKRPADMVHIR